MNFKKGLVRLFVVGLVISAIVGFFNVDREGLQANNRFYFDSLRSIEKEVKDPACIEMLKRNNVGTDPAHTKFEGRCYHINLFWDTIQSAKNPKDPSVTSKVAIAAVENARFSSHWQRIGFETAIYVFGYLFLCLLAWIVFITFRWIKKGFTNS